MDVDVAEPQKKKKKKSAADDGSEAASPAEPKSVAAAAVPTDPTVVRRFPAGSKVVIKGLTGPAETQASNAAISGT